MITKSKIKRNNKIQKNLTKTYKNKIKNQIKEIHKIIKKLSRNQKQPIKMLKRII